MKRFKTAVILLILNFSLNAQAQYVSWDPVLTVSSGNGNFRPRIGVSGSDPVVVWGNQGNNSIMFSRLSGFSFTTPVQLNPAGTSAYVQDWTGPEMAVKGDSIYIVFKFNPIQTAGIYMVHSYDGGLTFSDTVRIDPDFGNIPWVPSVEVEADGTVLVAYMESDADWAEPRYVTSKSINGGQSFLQPVDATRLLAPGEVCDCCPASLVSGNGKTFVLFRNNENNLRVIYASVSNDQAASFDTTSRLDLTTTISSQCQSTGPDGFIANDSLYTFWRASSGGLRAFMSSSHVDSLDPVVHRKLYSNIPSTAIQNYPKAVYNGGTSAVVWQETAVNLGAEIFLSYDTTNAPYKLGTTRDTVNVSHTGFQINPDVRVNNGFHICWQDNNDGKVYYRKGVPAAPLGIIKDEKVLNVFPNPFSNGFNLNLAPDEIAEVSDINGRSIYTGMKKGFIDMSEFSNGNYFLIIKSRNSVRKHVLIKSSDN